jgi:hypothetical protein
LKLFVVDGYPDPEINAQYLAEIYPADIIFEAELTTEGV